MSRRSILEVIECLANPKRAELFRLICEENEPTSFSELTQKAALSAAQTHNHLKILVDSGLVDRVERLVINRETHKPMYRFYELSEAGEFFKGHFTRFTEDLKRLLPYFGTSEKTYRSGVRLRFMILQKIYESENGLTPSELLDILRDHVSSAAVLSHHLSKLEKALFFERDKMDKRKIRYRIKEDVPTELLYLLRLEL